MEDKRLNIEDAYYVKVIENELAQKTRENIMLKALVEQFMSEQQVEAEQKPAE